MRLIMIFLILQAAWAQHSGGFAAGGVGARGFAGRGFGARGLGTRGFAGRGPIIRSNRGFGRRFGNGFINPYLPFFWDYGLWGDYPYWGDNENPGWYENEAPPPPDAFLLPSPPVQAPPQRAEPPVTAHAVIHEYKVAHEPGENKPGANAFTIALKDGSQRAAVASWVQDQKLYYVDSEGRQQVLASDLIDRHATERLNQQNHLQMQLPPG